VIVVDDGSQDRTAELAIEAGAKVDSGSSYSKGRQGKTERVPGRLPCHHHRMGALC